ncbi:MAG: hypothetical protein ACTHNV_22905 [Ralstonia sp.]|uniref:hypothetical protein n=1 Tax=Ralstonia sp. TaxID=54061 RepID=UPI003F7E5EF2
MRHRLVIVEGIMGSGKSTTMRFIAEKLREANVPSLAIHERTDPHPVRATDDLAHWFQPWLDITPDQLVQRSVEKWSVFVKTVLQGDTVPVIDGQLFHGDGTNLFLMEADDTVLVRYVRDVSRTIAPLAPFILYFRQEDVAEAIRTVCAERGPEWVSYQVNWKLAAPFCTRRGLVGVDGLIDLYRDYRRMTDRLFDLLPFEKLAIENSRRNWPSYQQLVLQALGLADCNTGAS